MIGLTELENVVGHARPELPRTATRVRQLIPTGLGFHELQTPRPLEAAAFFSWRLFEEPLEHRRTLVRDFVTDN